jgi:hypothetical protein
MPRTVYEHVDDHPLDLPNSVWISEDPEMWFKISARDEQFGVFGKLVTRKKEYNIEVEFGDGTNVEVYDTGEDIGPILVYSLENHLFSADCTFSRDELTMDHIELLEDKIFDPMPNKITFIRKSASEESVKELVNTNSVAVLKEGTSFDDIQVIEGKIYFYFTITLRNKGDIDRTVRLRQDFSEYNEIDVIDDDFLESVTSDGAIETYEVKAGSTVTYPVLFSADYKGGEYKSLLLVPGSIAAIEEK